jgi:serine/threonine protein kinase
MQETMQVTTTAKATKSYGPYTLLERLGAGGMAEVYRAVRTGPQGFSRTFALKRILAGQSLSASFVQMFCTEARISALLEHPNIVQVHDFGQIDRTYYLAMEYLKGDTVLAVGRTLHARKLQFPVSTAAYIARQVALGLSYAHGLRDGDGKPLGLIHRDINPSNIMLLDSGGVKLLDFGIAKAPSLAKHQTETGFIKGKPSYCSPEQLKEKPLDGRSDVFSLGVTLWEMLTMRKLFLGRTDFETVTNVMKRPIPAPSTLRREVPPELDEIVLRALERDASKRPDAKELADRLGEYLRKAYYLEDALVDLLEDLRRPAPARPLAQGHVLADDGPTETDVLGSRELARLQIEADELGPARAESSEPAPPPVVITGAVERARPSRVSVALALAGVIAVGSVVAAHAASVRRQGAARAAKMAVATAAAGRADDAVVVELDSAPSGAVVERGDGQRAGVTPLVMKVARGNAPVLLVVRKDGFEPRAHEVVPRQDSISTVDLQPLSLSDGASPPPAQWFKSP